jgi:hypothetical protein
MPFADLMTMLKASQKIAHLAVSVINTNPAADQNALNAWLSSTASALQEFSRYGLVFNAKTGEVKVEWNAQRSDGPDISHLGYQDRAINVFGKEAQASVEVIKAAGKHMQDRTKTLLEIQHGTGAPKVMKHHAAIIMATSTALCTLQGKMVQEAGHTFQAIKKYYTLGIARKDVDGMRAGDARTSINPLKPLGAYKDQNYT